MAKQNLRPLSQPVWPEQWPLLCLAIWLQRSRYPSRPIRQPITLKNQPSDDWIDRLGQKAEDKIKRSITNAG